MVYGNRDNESGCGVLSTRNPCTGQKEIIGEYLTNTEGTEVVDGMHMVLTLDQLREANGSNMMIHIYDNLPENCSLYDKLIYYATKLEHHFHDMQVITLIIYLLIVLL